MSKTLNTPLKLHLGCGSNYFPGYLNIDKLADQTPLVAARRVDINSDLFDLRFRTQSVSEIRLHHVFEHFHRYQVVVLMYYWNRWLKLGGQLIIETPNFYGSVKTYLLSAFLGRKHQQYTVLRHLYGSKEAGWASHLEGWDKTTMSDIFSLMGFKVINVVETSGLLAIVKLTGEKTTHLSFSQFLPLSRRFLTPFVVNPFEINVWLKEAKQLFVKMSRNHVTHLPHH